jgi:hypothetical protein
MPSITYLQLDASYDPIFNPANSLTDIDAVRQAIMTTILLFQGEWWENLNAGTPMFQLILGHRATPNNLQIMEQALSNRIASVPYVSGVLSISVNFDNRTRKFSYQATVSTSFGNITVSSSPGLNAGLGG